MEKMMLKLTYISGLKEVVLAEISEKDIEVVESFEEFLYCMSVRNISDILELRSVTGAYVMTRGIELNPSYLSKHKSFLGKLVDQVFLIPSQKWKTFALSCAGSHSKEVLEIKKYLSETYKLEEKEEADLKVSLGKVGEQWEVSVSIAPRPLSVRNYRVSNLVGALNPTIAYAMNSLCDLSHQKSYLNVCSGSATLLIEAGISNPNLILKGFDIDGKRIAESVKNIKEAGLIKSVELIRADIFENPDLGIFDVITADLPFGMQIGKGEDLEKLYSAFVSYCEKHLSGGGVLVAYTTEHELLSSLLEKSQWKVTHTLSLKVVSSVNSYLYPKIFVCQIQ